MNLACKIEVIDNRTNGWYLMYKYTLLVMYAWQNVRKHEHSYM